MASDVSSACGSGNISSDPLGAAVAVANIPTLLMVLVQLTGETRWLEPPYVIARTKGFADNDTGGLPDTLQAELRAAALTAIKAWRAGAPIAIPEPSPDLMVRMLSVSMGEEVPPEYGEFLAEELTTGLEGLPSPESVDIPAGFRAVIIGAGLSGILTAIKMDGLGIPYLIFEKDQRVGGVWSENLYPGVAVDTPSHLYSYSFAHGDWSRYFAEGDEIRDYLDGIADDFDVRSRIHFGTEVVSAEFDEAERVWSVRVRDAGGVERLERANVIFSCVGAFHPPVVPNIPGLNTFDGPVFHTARWPAGLDLAGKRVAIVGNGATAMQVVPAIADSVQELTIFQRSPQWAQPFPKFKQAVPDAMRLMFEQVPLFRAWYRLRMSWMHHDKLYKALQRDPAWADSTSAINAINDGHRAYFTEYIKSELVGREDLLEKVVPNYPPFGKRMLADNGWFRALTRPHVHLVTDAIAEVRPEGVVTCDGVLHEVDILVLATGFDVGRFISSYEVRGRGGRRLREVWDDDDGRAYLGLFVREFPNFFAVYGPNTQTGHGGSLIHTVEAQLNYSVSLLKQMFDRGTDVAEVRHDVYESYAATVDDMHERMIWTHPAMTTYYRNARGRVVGVNPFRNIDFWRMTRHADLGEFNLESAQVAASEGSAS